MSNKKKASIALIIFYLCGTPIAYNLSDTTISGQGRYPIREQATPMLWLCTGLSWFTVITFWAETIIFDSPEAPKPPVQG